MNQKSVLTFQLPVLKMLHPETILILQLRNRRTNYGMILNIHVCFEINIL